MYIYTCTYTHGGLGEECSSQADILIIGPQLMVVFLEEVMKILNYEALQEILFLWGGGALRNPTSGSQPVF